MIDTSGKKLYEAIPQMTLQPNQRVPVVFGEANHIYCFDANQDFKIAIEGDDPSDFRKGRSFTANRTFNMVEVINTSATDVLTVKLGFGLGAIEDRATVVEGNVPTKSGDTLETLTPVAVATTATQLFGADTDATRRWIQPPTDIYIGGVGVTTANGILITGGSTGIIETGAVVYGICASGTVTTRLMQEKV